MSPTIFSRFIQGSVSYALPSSTLQSIETCGEKTTRQLNAVSCHLIKLAMEQVISLQKYFVLNEEDEDAEAEQDLE